MHVHKLLSPCVFCTYKHTGISIVLKHAQPIPHDALSQVNVMCFCFGYSSPKMYLLRVISLYTVTTIPR